MHALRKRIGAVAAALAAVVLTPYAAIQPGLLVHRHAGGDHTHIHPDDLDHAYQPLEPEHEEHEHARGGYAASGGRPAWREPAHADAGAHWHVRSPLHPAVAVAAVALPVASLFVPWSDAPCGRVLMPSRLPVRVRGPPGVVQPS